MQGAAAALGFQLFETDMGELLFSGLTPNLPLMDGPPNSPLLQAHSGAARKQKAVPCRPPSPTPLAGKWISRLFVRAHCQGLLHNQRPAFPKQRRGNDGFQRDACGALQTPELYIGFKM